MRIGIYGGTFNPPHIGHRRSAAAAVTRLRLDLLIVIPAGVPPHKTLPEGVPPAQTRFLLTETTFNDADNVIVSDMETLSPTPVYTIDTVKSIQEKYPGAELFLLTGTDMFLTLMTWRESEALIKSVTPVVFSRDLNDSQKIADYSRKLKKLTGAETVTVYNETIVISSSELRMMLPLRKGAGYIADTTYSYIIKNRLYGAKPEWDWLKAKARSMLDPERITHVDGCEEEAIRLADRWGIDADEAREAAILHDITKKLSPEENIAILETEGIAAGKPISSEAKLLHAKTGAILAKNEFGVSEEVADAIRWHTTGRAYMTNLEKIIYLADYIEPARTFEGVEALRAMAYENLDRAMISGLEMSVEDMRERGIIPNNVTIDALKSLIT